MITVGAGMPAKQAAQWMARASPVFAGMPAPIVIVQKFQSSSTTVAPDIKKQTAPGLKST
ncbi:hypothetical protein BGP81_02235 [Pseudomonas putida]|nr:hypothetical protein BGP81_02235 [Pseudomonas putida]